MFKIRWVFTKEFNSNLHGWRHAASRRLCAPSSHFPVRSAEGPGSCPELDRASRANPPSALMLGGLRHTHAGMPDPSTSTVNLRRYSGCSWQRATKPRGASHDSHLSAHHHRGHHQLTVINSRNFCLRHWLFECFVPSGSFDVESTHVCRRRSNNVSFSCDIGCCCCLQKNRI